MGIVSLQDVYQQMGAVLAPDGIPLHFGDLKAEYHAALKGCIVLDRSHEGRLMLRGVDRFDLLNRMSTNNMLNMKAGEGRATIFINANARILDRTMVYHQGDDDLLMLTSPGRGQAMVDYLQRNIFFADKVTLHPLMSETRLFALHGMQADDLMVQLMPDSVQITGLHGINTTLDDMSVFIGRNTSLLGSAWIILVAAEFAADVWQKILQAGAKPAGGLTYNTLRIRAGLPARELSIDYIPLELGLWDDVSFNKGCYTGQEIIARMESRNKLAKMLVRLELNQFIESPVELFHDGKRAGILTSSVQSPDDEVFAMGVVKTDFAHPDVQLTTPDGAIVRVDSPLGVQR